MLGAFGEATVRQTIKFRDQKPPKTRRFACSGSFIEKLYDEVVELRGEITNFCLILLRMLRHL